MEKPRGYRSPLGPLWAASEARPSDKVTTLKTLPMESLGSIVEICLGTVKSQYALMDLERRAATLQ